MQENVVCRRLGRFGQAFFQTATASFRSAAVRITRTIVFGAQLRSRPTKSLAYDSRFSNYVSRYRGVAEEELDQSAMRGRVTLVTPKGFASEGARREVSLKARNSRVPALTF